MKFSTLLWNSTKFLGYFIIKIFYTITIDLYKNTRLAFIYAFKPEEKATIKRTLEAEKMVTLINERLKRVERLLYSIYEDPDYGTSDRGKNDLKELKKETT